MNENFEIIYELLTTGSYTVDKIAYDLNYINQQLRILNCAAREWYDKQTLILVYTELPNERGKFEIVNRDIKLFKQLINNEIVLDERIDFLCENGWVEKELNGIYALSKKFLMQFKEFILENSSLYNVCGVCQILVKNEKEHQYCRNKKESLKKKLK